jgi:hypothetical protein
MGRIIFVGKNSRVWQRLVQDPTWVDGIGPVLGHADVAGFDFQQDDSIWIFSYSRRHEENIALFKQLKERGAQQVFYVSTASSNVMQITPRFTYPRAKSEAAKAAQQILGARTVLLGYVVDNLKNAPSGWAAIVTLEELSAAMRGYGRPFAPEGPIRLFTMRETPFRSRVESIIYYSYFILACALGRYVFVLRPVDIILRALGYRWYGYFGMSNQIWSTTTSS